MSCLLFTACFLACFQIAVSNFNTDRAFTGTHINASKIAISPNSQFIAVGFSDGRFKLFDKELNQRCTTNSTNYSIADIIWYQKFGPVTLDSNNTITRWQMDCNFTNSISFEDPIIGVSGYEQKFRDKTVYGYIAVNFGDVIEQYDIETGKLMLIYDFKREQTFVEIAYTVQGEDEDVLLAETKVEGTNKTMVRRYDTLDGTEMNSFQLKSPIRDISSIQLTTGKVVIAMGEDKHMIKFDQKNEIVDRDEFPKSTSLAVCSATRQLALAHPDTKSVGIYYYAGALQYLILPQNTEPQDIDCSEQYLVALDKNGNINVYTYEEYKTWTVAIIAGIAGGLVVLVVGVIVVIQLSKKWAKDENQDQYKAKQNSKYSKPSKKSSAKSQSFANLSRSTLKTTIAE